jgi:hypothetical protein
MRMHRIWMSRMNESQLGQNPCVATEQKRKKLHHNKKVFLFSVMFIEPQE